MPTNFGYINRSVKRPLLALSGRLAISQRSL